MKQSPVWIAFISLVLIGILPAINVGRDLAVGDPPNIFLVGLTRVVALIATVVLLGKSAPKLVFYLFLVLGSGGMGTSVILLPLELLTDKVVIYITLPSALLCILAMIYYVSLDMKKEAEKI